MSVRSLSTFAILVVLNVVSAVEVATIQVSVEASGTVANDKRLARRVEAQSAMETEVKVHTVSNHSDTVHSSQADGSFYTTKHSPEVPHASFEQKAAVKRNSRPKLTGYANDDCGGAQKGSFVLPLGADLTQDHCLEVKDADTDMAVARMKISCDGTGVAKACIWHSPNDTSCELSEPFCLNIQPADTAIVASGACIPVKEHPSEEDSFARFTDFPQDFKWPDCLVPPMSMSLLLIVAMAGVSSASIVLCVIWYCCFALPRQPKHQEWSGWGEGKGMPPMAGKGGKGKGFPGGKM